MKGIACAVSTFLFALSLLFAGCAQNAPPQTEKDETPPQLQEDGMKIALEIGGMTFSATLVQSEAARAFAARLPLTLRMSELNGNEKYIYIDEALPAAAQRVGSIAAGDLMLYGSNCIVLFYESFATSYSYTPLGRLDDASGIVQAVGSGSVTVTFSIMEE